MNLAMDDGGPQPIGGPERELILEGGEGEADRHHGRTPPKPGPRHRRENRRCSGERVRPIAMVQKPARVTNPRRSMFFNNL